MDRFDLYGALYIVCSEWHSGQSSRGYRILSRLSRAGYRPGSRVSRGLWETPEMREIVNILIERYADKL